jgi:type VI secretion system secreted protein VgrG
MATTAQEYADSLASVFASIGERGRKMLINTPLGEDVLLLTRFSGTEELGRPFQFRLELVSRDFGIRFEDIVGENVTVGVEMPNGKTRYFNGFVSRFIQTYPRSRYARYEAEIVPWLWFLTRTSDCRIFQEMTVPDIIMRVFRDHGFTDFEDALTGAHRTWEYCVQYRESDFNFVSRLMEQEGIYYYFRQENGKHTLVLCDSMSQHEPFSGYEQIPFRPVGEQSHLHETVSDWVLEQQVQPGVFAHNDFDFENPKKALRTSSSIARAHAVPDFEIYDYPGEYTEFDDGEGYARARIEEIQSQFEVVRGTSNGHGICPGYKFELVEHPREDQCREYLVTSAAYHAQYQDIESSNPPGGDGAIFSCSFAAISTEESFRPARITPKPVVQGPQTAIAVGPKGEEIHTDKHGRVKVQFHWDRYGQANENSSCWIRVAQSWAGKKWGAMFIPRIGQEVIVEFLEGDPDRPIITGRVYNGEAMPPYELPGNKTLSTVKSNSSKGGGGFNEIRFEDKKGEEQVFIFAQKNQDVRVQNNEYEWVGSDRHLLVKSNQLEKVEGDKHLTVDGDHVEKISGDQNSTVESSRIVSVYGDESLTVGGDQLHLVSGDANLKVKQNQMVQADGDIHRVAGGKMQEKVGTVHALEAGQEIHLKGGMKVVIEAGMQVTLKGPGGFVDIGPAGVTIQGTLVNINSGGSAGSGSGSSPKSPSSPGFPDTPDEPEEADTAEAGEVDQAKSNAQNIDKETPLGSTELAPRSPAAEVLKDAAQSGTPFCEVCEAARRKET